MEYLARVARSTGDARIDRFAEAKKHPFCESLMRREVPELAPEGTYGNDREYRWDSFALHMDMRYLANSDCGMWAIVDKKWTGELAEWIGERSVLEIMAGRGWLAKALFEHGVEVTATDDYSWHRELPHVFPVQQKECYAAVRESDADVLVVSWPPMQESLTLHTTCLAWGRERPIVYIGEGPGGCTAQGRFWNCFSELEGAPSIELPSWSGLHDFLSIGTYGYRR